MRPQGQTEMSKETQGVENKANIKEMDEKP